MTYSAVRQILSVFSIKNWQLIGLTILVISITLSILLYKGKETHHHRIYNSTFYTLCQQGKCTHLCLHLYSVGSIKVYLASTNDVWHWWSIVNGKKKSLNESYYPSIRLEWLKKTTKHRKDLWVNRIVVWQVRHKVDVTQNIPVTLDLVTGQDAVQQRECGHHCQ